MENIKHESNVFRLIKSNIDTSKILQEINARDDWEGVFTLDDIYVYKKPPLFILPLTLGVCEDNSIFQSEGTQHTPWRNEYPSILEFLGNNGFTEDRVKRCSFFKIPVGGHLGMHNEYSKYYQNKDRWHLCIQGQYRYFVENEEYIINAGDFFWFDNKKDHAVINIGNVDRISFIWDALMVPKDPFVGDIRPFVK